MSPFSREIHLEKFLKVFLHYNWGQLKLGELKAKDLTPSSKSTASDPLSEAHCTPRKRLSESVVCRAMTAPFRAFLYNFMLRAFRVGLKSPKFSNRPSVEQLPFLNEANVEAQRSFPDESLAKLWRPNERRLTLRLTGALRCREINRDVFARPV